MALGAISLVFSCEMIEDKLATETEKKVKLLTEGGVWKVDSLVMMTDVLNGSVSTITSDSIALHVGTLQFTDPESSSNAGYGAGFVIHTYEIAGVTQVDTMAWTPYNFQSGNDNVITIFYETPNSTDWVVGATDMYFDLLKFKDKEVRIGSWRRFDAFNGTANGVYKRYHLTR